MDWGRFHLTGGECHNITEAENLLFAIEDLEAVITNKAFDATNLLGRIQEMGARGVIWPRGDRKEVRGYSVHHNKCRNLIEPCFARTVPPHPHLLEQARRSLRGVYFDDFRMYPTCITSAAPSELIQFLNRHSVIQLLALNAVLLFERSHSTMGNQRCQRRLALADRSPHSFSFEDARPTRSSVG